MKNLHVLFLFLFICHTAGAQVYVDHKATGDNDGTSWQDAFIDLEEAVDAATPGSDIWMASGVYYPVATINLDERGIDLYGSFSGSESSPSERSFAQRTIISGDVNRDDIQGDPYTNATDNLKHVLFIIESSPMVIDGLTIEGGRADGDGILGQQSASGAGIFCNGTIVIKNCVVRDNFASRGGGVYLVHTLSNPGIYRLENCIIEDNETTVGSGGVYAGFGGTTSDFINVTFRNNKSREGGAILVAGASQITNASFADCVFDNNSAVWGGAVEVEGFGRPTFDSCLFSNNTAARGGAVNINDFSKAIFYNCDWKYNTAIPLEVEPGIGGALYLDDGSSVELVNNDFVENSAENAGAAICLLDFSGDEITAHINGGSFQNNISEFGLGGAVYIQGLINANMEEASFSNNLSSEGGAIFTNGESTVEVDKSTFIENMADYGGALLINEYDDNVRITDSEFTRNFSYADGGAIYNFRGARARVRSCTFQSNESGNWGGAVYSLGRGSDQLSIYSNCQFLSNRSDFAAGAFYHGNGNMFILNSAFHNNMAVNGGIGNAISTNQYDDIQHKLVLVNSTFHEDAPGLGAITQWSNDVLPSVIESRNSIFSGAGDHWAIEGGDVNFTSLGGNLSSDESMQDILIHAMDINDKDPKYVDGDADDLRLSATSPCIDAGITEGAPSGDITGRARIRYPDIGAYELQEPCDADGGDIYMAAGGDKVELCAGQVKFSVRHQSDSELPYYYVITDAQDMILTSYNSAESSTLDLSDAPAGECHVWGFSYDRISVPNVGAHISSLFEEDCGDLSEDFITVLRLTEEECYEPCHTPRNVRVRNSKYGAKISWSQVPDARYYDLKISYGDNATPHIFRVSSNNIDLTTSRAHYKVSVRTICGLGAASDFSDLVIIGEMTSEAQNKASTRSVDISIEETSAELNVAVYPNPVRDRLYIQLSDSHSGKGQLEVFDVAGKVRLNQTIDIGLRSLDLDVSQLTAGAYQLIITNEVGMQHSQLIHKIDY